MKHCATPVRLSTRVRLLAVCALVWVSSFLAASAAPVTITRLNIVYTLSTNVDLKITDATPFGNKGVVNIPNTGYGALILSAVKPSAALALLADHVKISGQTAVDGTNCQVKLYGQGTIILPYGDDVRPLTVYSGQNFTGIAVSDFGLEDTGGFMNTLTDAKLNNQIRSFRLKRGYMVTFSIRAGGYGYSRCFIAADQDLNVATLPAVLDRHISSYRIFKWYDASKKGLANAATDVDACQALNVTTTYEWWKGRDSTMASDVEIVAHHYKESWPTVAACGAAAGSPHLKTNNEPRNTNDDESCDLDAILANWEALMATGKRLCSPSSWDGSDYWNGTGFLKEFFNAIDARGWRCDIVDMHCYWPAANFGNLENWYNSVHRPVWVSEWVWGASWGTNDSAKGAFASGVTEAQNAQQVQAICEKMNAMPYVERYYYWNAEAAISKVYNNGTLTAAGRYYASMDPGLAYNGNCDYVPTTPPQSAPSQFTTITAAGHTNLRWYDANGELNQSMAVEYSPDGSSWQTVSTPEQQETAANYTTPASKGAGYYRIHVVDLNGTNLYSDVLTVGDGNSYYLFNIGAGQWLSTGGSWGTHATLTPNGGYDVLIAKTTDDKYTIDTQLLNNNNHYLTALTNGPWMDQVKSEWTFTEVGTHEGRPTYLVSMNGLNLAYDGSSSSLVMTTATDATAQWQLQTLVDRLALLRAATPDAPVDATFLVAGYGFDQYDMRNNVWQGSPKIGGLWTGAAGNYCAEKFNTAFDVYQTISGAPAGRYLLMAQGFYRHGGYADAAQKHNAGTEQLQALLYANEASVPLQSIFTEAGRLSVGVTTAGISGQFPNSMSEAAQFFLAECYDNTLPFTLAEGDELRIGVRKTATTTNDWAIFDNFRLLYLGPVEGDVDGNTTLDQNDVEAMARHLTGQTLAVFNTQAADLNGDQKIDIADIVRMIELILKK